MKLTVWLWPVAAPTLKLTVRLPVKPVSSRLRPKARSVVPVSPASATVGALAIDRMTGMTSSSVTMPLAVAVPSVATTPVPVAPVRVTPTISAPSSTSSLSTGTISVPTPLTKLTAWVWAAAVPMSKFTCRVPVKVVSSTLRPKARLVVPVSPVSTCIGASVIERTMAVPSSSVTMPLAVVVPSATVVPVPVAPVKVTAIISVPLARSSLGTCTVSVPMPLTKLTAWL
ncbi:hypothetical protein LOS8367_03197 [Limimaricola soesokkakensis]|uniref:Uncharacterized protein n=1 Tax=Limimaricola soesokkakensis TaxID=1343159 RepID=A0A1X6ZY68_9RHOB|nr:hypothetical protein LOS8367_03197 [Limimaricola soesokkakensis]